MALQGSHRKKKRGAVPIQGASPNLVWVAKYFSHHGESFGKPDPCLPTLEGSNPQFRQ